MSFRLAYFVAVLCSVYAITAAIAVDAHAHSPGPTEYEALLIADRWAATEAPTLPNHCANGRRTITRSNAAVEQQEVISGLSILGFADGWAWSETGWRWDYARCTWTTREDLGPEDQCAVDAHEQMHYVIGPEHIGPLDPRHPGPVECYSHNDRVETKRKRVRRTKKQIARSIRYRKAQARIKARAAMRAIHEGDR